MQRETEKWAERCVWWSLGGFFVGPMGEASGFYADVSGIVFRMVLLGQKFRLFLMRCQKKPK